MASERIQASKESTTTTIRNSRRRPLHSCWVSILTIANIAFIKAEILCRPLPLINKRLANLALLATPFIHAIQYQWLAFLSFVDNQILAIENIVVTCFPPSIHAFNKLEDLLLMIEIFPWKFENTLNKFPIVLRRVQFLDWVLTRLISWLTFLIPTLIECVSDWGDGPREREIMVDTDYKESTAIDSNHVKSPPPGESENIDKFPPISSSRQETETVGMTINDSVGMKCTYKEVLEKGIEKITEHKEEFKEENYKGIVGKEEKENLEKRSVEAKTEDIVKKHSILELFEASWHMNLGN